MRVGIIGAGLIGKALYERVNSLGWTVDFVLKRDGLYGNLTDRIDAAQHYPVYLYRLDACFLAISTKDNGEAAYEYMTKLLNNEIPVVTCEKGALANYFPELERKLGHVGYNASVGGGTQMLSYVESHLPYKTEELHAVINGTLNYLFDTLAGRTLEDALAEAQREGYTEPGVTRPLTAINAEACYDIPRKTAILFNTARLCRERVRAKDFLCKPITAKELARLEREASFRRYVVSFTKSACREDVLAGFQHRVGDWTISAGFKNIYDQPILQRFLPTGCNNALLIKDASGIYTLTGPGAGPGPTVSAMINDALKLYTLHL